MCKGKNGKPKRSSRLEGIAEQNEKQYERLLAYAKRMLK